MGVGFPLSPTTRAERPGGSVSRLCVFVIACLLAPAAFAQVAQIDKGTPEDMRGSMTVFVDTGVRTDLRDAIIANIRKELPEVTIAGSIDEAHLVIRFQTTVAPRGPDLEQEDADRRAIASQRSSTVRPVPPPPPANPGDRSGGVGRADPRTPVTVRHDQIETGRSRSETFDVLRPDPEETPRESRYAIGSVLKPTAAKRFTEALSYVRRVEGEAVHSVRDFVKKFAKAYRKANPRSS